VKTWSVTIDETRVDRDEVVEFLARIFGPNYHDALVAQGFHFDHEPSLSPRNIVQARSAQGELIGVIRLVERQILVEGVALAAAGLSSVSVHPAWRRRGVSADLMNAAIRAATERGFDVSVLYGRRAVDGYYPRFGYHGIGRYGDLELLSRPEPVSSVEAVPLAREHVALGAEAYRRTYEALTGSVLRDRPVWAYLLRRLRQPFCGQRVWVCREGGRDVGYLVVADEKLVELAVPDTCLPAVPGLLGRLGAASISVHPRHPFFIYCRTHWNTVLKERLALDGGYMARVLDGASLLKKLAPVLARRAAAAGAAGQVLRMLGVEVDLGSGRVSESAAADDISFEHAEKAVLLLLGVMAPQDVVGVRWPRDKPWLARLFPELYFHTSAWDEI
jgi:predicted N-acetyltransferase YhbS